MERRAPLYMRELALYMRVREEYDELQWQTRGSPSCCLGGTKRGKLKKVSIAPRRVRPRGEGRMGEVWEDSWKDATSLRWGFFGTFVERRRFYEP